MRMKRFAKAIYNFLPLKKQLFLAIRRFGVPSRRIYQHLHFKGDFTVRIDQTSSFHIRHYGFEMENDLFWGGIDRGSEKTALRMWCELVGKASVIFDVGANTGIYSLAAKALSPNAKLIAIEPVHRVFEKLVVNCWLNNFDISCIEAALSDEDGEATLFDFPGEHSYSSTFHKEIFGELDLVETQVKVVRLDTLVNEYQIDKIDLMKIDVEGHEADVLRGFGDCLERFKPTILIEVLSDEVGASIDKILSEYNYTYYYVDETRSEVIKVDELTRRESLNYIVCSAINSKC